MNKINNKETFYAVCSLIMIVIAIYLFSTNKQVNKSIYFAAVLILVVGVVMAFWVRFFFEVKPMKLSILLTVIVIIIAILTMGILKFLGVDTTAPIAIIVSIVTGDYLKKNSESIQKIFNKYFIK
jgi:hypothetical protein